MMAALRQWWPALPALLILYLGGSAVLEKYPRAPGQRAEKASLGGAPDSLLAYARQSLHAAQRPADTIVPADPFRSIHAPRPAGSSQAVKMEPPPRRFGLKGTVGTNVATLTNNAGQRQIVKVGDWIDSAEVVSIEANKVILKDRAGRFELLFNK
ncbi:MAG: hypothetical protein ABI036_14575 [Fibrobacteria bacterium]